MSTTSRATPTAEIPASAIASPRPGAGQRLVSLDAFRGFTMFWLLGGKAFVWRLPAWASALSPTVSGIS